jgi:hypothetical protein
VAPWLSELLAAPSGRPQYSYAHAAIVWSRALVVADIVEVNVYDSGGVEILRATRALDLADPTASLDVAVPSGDGYTIQVNVYNTDVSATEPVVTGTAGSVSVAEGALSAVTITCTPSSPTRLNEGKPQTLSVVPWVLEPGGNLGSVVCRDST